MSTIHLGKNIFSTIRQFQHVLAGCSSCQVVWIHKEKMCHIPSEEVFRRLSMALVLFNQLSLNYNDHLLAVGIEKISYGFCSKCIATNPVWASKFKAKQRYEGNFDCFGSAKHGYCDQFTCSRYHVCVHDQDNPPSSLGFFQKLYHEARNHFAVNTSN